MKQGFRQYFEFCGGGGEVGTPKFSVDVEGVWGHAPSDFFYNWFYR